MSAPRNSSNNGFVVKKHNNLSASTEEEFRQNPTGLLEDADRGIQRAIVAVDGKVRSIIGLNGTRYLPDPDPDPLDEILRLALQSSDGAE